MTKYLTTSQYRLADDGIPFLSSMPDATLARYINRAESALDAYMGFELQLGGFEAHTGWVQHPWDPKTLRTRIPNWPVPIRQALRYRIQISNISLAGSGFFATINPGDVAYNVFYDYIEIVPLQAITYSLTPVIMQLGLQPPIVQLDYEAGYYLSGLGEPLYDVSPKNDHTVYQAARGFWATTYDMATSIQPMTLPPIPPVVYVNGVVQSASTYTLDPTNGIVTFVGSQLSSAVVTADITYTIPDAVRDATIAQTSWLLGQRGLNQQGMLGLDRVNAQGRELMRGKVNPGSTDAALAHEALSLLEPYKMVPLF